MKNGRKRKRAKKEEKERERKKRKKRRMNEIFILGKRMKEFFFKRGLELETREKMALSLLYFSFLLSISFFLSLSILFTVSSKRCSSLIHNIFHPRKILCSFGVEEKSSERNAHFLRSSSTHFTSPSLPGEIFPQKIVTRERKRKMTERK